MKVVPIVFSMEGCPHCDRLKNKFKELEIDFNEVDVNEPKNEALYESFSKKVDNDYLPAVVVGKKVFLPDVSFKSIDEGMTMIKEYLQVLADRENRSD
jgi:glutaredoxin